MCSWDMPCFVYDKVSFLKLVGFKKKNKKLKIKINKTVVGRAWTFTFLAISVPVSEQLSLSLRRKGHLPSPFSSCPPSLPFPTASSPALPHTSDFRWSRKGRIVWRVGDNKAILFRTIFPQYNMIYNIRYYIYSIGLGKKKPLSFSLSPVSVFLVCLLYSLPQP